MSFGAQFNNPVSPTARTHIAVLHRDNHYVPRLYLKRWSSTHERLWTYRTLVSNPHVPLWRESSIKGVAYHSHLYTRILSGHESDEIEKWFGREFEAPAEDAIIKATSDQRLTMEDWEHLIRFLAAQDVRTPARLTESLVRWETEIPELLNRTMVRAIRKAEEAKAAGKTIVIRSPPENRGDFPLRISTEAKPDEDVVLIKAEIIAGRALWLSSMARLLTKTARALHRHKWTILSPPKGSNWFTSDDPVIRLNYYRNGVYDFKGGWDNRGTDILLPLGPQHLLYTQVGTRPPRRGATLPRAHSDILRRCIAEHAHRMIFSVEPTVEVPKLRPRRVDAEAFAAENEHWRRWNEEQTRIERELFDRPKES